MLPSLIFMWLELLPIIYCQFSIGVLLICLYNFRTDSYKNLILVQYAYPIDACIDFKILFIARHRVNQHS